MVNTQFHTYDYVVFGASLALSLLIGLVFMIIDWRNKKQTTEDYLMGGQGVNPVATGFSMVASLMNAIFLIGGPAEVHYSTATISLIGVSWVPTAIVSAHVFVPLFRRIRVISCYEYLELRFNAPIIRLAASLVFSIAVILFLSVVLYVPAIAVMQVTGLAKEYTIIACGIVCLIYVFMGGMKAVIWADFVQMLIMIGGLLALTIKGAQMAGGSQHVYEYALNNSRFNFDVFDPDPRTRHTFWTQVFGAFFIWAPLYGSNQMMVQRYHSVATVRQAQIAVYASVAVALLMLFLVTMLGLVMYDFYSEADPFICGQVKKGDQLVPYFLMEVFGDYPGVPGLFIAAVFAASLSSVSSALNSLTAVMLEDFIKPIVKFCGKTMSEKQALWTSRLLAIFFGFLTIGLSFAAEHMGGVIIQMTSTIWGTVESPLYGVFVLANFFPCANAWGAMAGLIVSLGINCWAAVGGLMHGDSPLPTFPLGMSCPRPPTTLYMDNMTSIELPMTPATAMYTANFTTTATTIPIASEVPEELMLFYQMSYVWLGLLGFVICVVVGLLVSCITEGIRSTVHPGEVRPIDPTLLWPCADLCCCCMPESCKSAVRCGVPQEKDLQRDYAEKSGYRNGGLDNPTFSNDAHEMTAKH